MWTMLDQYGTVILDYTALFTELDEGLVNRLKNGRNVCVAPTFGCECRQMPLTAPAALARRMQRNFRALSGAGLRVNNDFGTVDTLGLARGLTGRGESVLVIEANYDVEDRFVLSGLRADVYNLLDKLLVSHRRYSDSEIPGRDGGAREQQEFHPVKPGDRVFADGVRRVLGDPLQDGSGTEAVVYHIKGEPELLAKVYRQDPEDGNMLTAQKLHNIHMLRQCEAAWKLPWAAMPQALLSVDEEGGKPVGFLMKRFGRMELAANHPLFGSGNVLEKFPACSGVTVGDVLAICQRLVRQTMFLAANDIHISDFNARNFGIPSGKEDYVAMLDADSFSCEDFRSEFFTYTALHPDEASAGTKLELLQRCSESLVAFVFSLLSLDVTFQAMRRGEFSFSATRLMQMKNPTQMVKWQSIPENLRSLFQRVFEKGEQASMSVLLHELETAAAGPAAQLVYSEAYRDIIAAAGGQPARQTTPRRRTRPVPAKAAPAAEPAQTVRPAQKQRMDRVTLANQVHNDRVPPARKRNRRPLAAWLTLCLALCLAVWLLFGDALQDTAAAGVAELHQAPAAAQSNLLRTDMPDGYYLSEDGDLDGYAEYYWYSGSVYRGEWSNGAMHGKGTLRLPGGSVYTGDFVHGSRTGIGTETTAEGTIYCGDFANGEWHGSGTLYDADGRMVYNGGFAHGLFDGRGSYYFPNGIEFMGDFVDGTGMYRESLPLGSAAGSPMLVEGSWYNNVFYGVYYLNGVVHTLPEI